MNPVRSKKPEVSADLYVTSQTSNGMKIVTHDGYFHTDDLFAVASFLLQYPEALITRTRDEVIIRDADTAVDVGQIYDPTTLRFDHHQKEGAGKRENGIPYASFGLVWKHLGEELAGGECEAEIIEERMVMAIDALDNGVEICHGVFEGVSSYTLTDYLDGFNDGAKILEDFDKKFFEVLPFVRELLKKEIGRAKIVAKDWEEVEKIYRESADKNIIVLPLNTHWKKIIVPTEARFVVFPRPNGYWSARAVPQKLNSFESKILFPLSWAGLGEKELPTVSGVSDATFCHRDRFIANARSKEGAIKLCQIALGGPTAK